MRHAVVLALTCSAFWIGAAHAQAGDTAAGRAVAQLYCTACHGEVTRPDQRAPAFATIASERARTNAEMTTWLLDPHPPMPDVRLSIPEIRDVILYIRSLAPPR